MTMYGIQLRPNKAEHQMDDSFVLDVIVCQGAAVLQLFAGKDKALLVRGYAFLHIELQLDSLGGI